MPRRPPDRERPLELTASGLVDQGLSRATNDDRMWVDVDHGWFVVADGMGGTRNGGRAAEVAVEVIVEHLTRVLLSHIDDAVVAAILTDAIRAADAAVNEDLGDHVSGGTTVVIAAVIGSGLHVAHAGDSRALLFDGVTLRHLTVDHNLAALYVESGRLTTEEARGHPSSSRLTSYVGMGSEMTVEHSLVPLNRGERVVLTTDGLTAMADDRTVQRVLADAGGPEEAAAALVAAALAGGGHDNIGVVVIDIG